MPAIEKKMSLAYARYKCLHHSFEYSYKSTPVSGVFTYEALNKDMTTLQKFWRELEERKTACSVK